MIWRNEILLSHGLTEWRCDNITSIRQSMYDIKDGFRYILQFIRLGKYSRFYNYKSTKNLKYNFKINSKREEFGEYNRLVQELSEDRLRFHLYFRMNKHEFEYLHDFIKNVLLKYPQSTTVNVCRYNNSYTKLQYSLNKITTWFKKWKFVHKQRAQPKYSP